MEIGRELRVARITAGKRQCDVARVIGTSTAQVSRIERGKVIAARYGHLARFAAAVGLKPSLRFYPAGRRLMDGPQVELIGKVRAKTHSSGRWETEVPMPIAADLRAADARLSLAGCTIVIEVFSRLADFQAQSRASLIKKRDLQADRLILAVAGTSTNRRALAEALAVRQASFPLGTKALFRALGEGRDPGADGILLL